MIAEHGAKAAEVGLYRRTRRQPSHPLLESVALAQPHLGVVLVELASDLHQHLDQDATELRVVPMFVMNNTVLRDVLMICTPWRSINCSRLKVSPSYPARPMDSVMREG